MVLGGILHWIFQVSSNSIHTLLLADANKIGEPKLSDH